MLQVFGRVSMNSDGTNMWKFWSVPHSVANPNHPSTKIYGNLANIYSIVGKANKQDPNLMRKEGDND